MIDKDDKWTESIKAAHPTRTGTHEQWAVAMEMAGNRHSKGALVELVHWLLVRVDEHRDALEAVLRCQVAGCLCCNPEACDACPPCPRCRAEALLKEGA